ncbi:SusC/RagA family TonB-linked outer membrane protein [Zunongwangia sp.]|uniref:SusC/RagA family TonB-linked outer membrane protein n=1 Tax=Zunongwangia sp. TaxID=1965325 RepID=UPI003AA7BCEA
MKIKHLKMKVSVILTLFCALQMFAIKGSAQKFNINLEDAKIATVIDQIKKQSDYKFFYREDLLQDAWKVTIKTNSTSIKDVLKQLFTNLPIDYVIKKKQVILKSKTTLNKNDQPSNNTWTLDQQEIYGNVSDQNGYPLMGVTVWRKGTRTGTVTNEKGNYRIQATKGDTLVFSFLGFKKIEKLVEGDKTLDIMMQEDINSLGEVKVLSTGYQNIKKERATGSFSVIKSENLKKINSNNVMNQLEGRVAGLQIDLLASDNTFVYGNQFGETEGNTSYKYRIRGQSTYKANDKPLLVIDGVPSELDIKNLNSNDIEKITFLKDAASASIYGARAANGVIVIDTKKGKKGATRINFSQNYTFSSKPSLSSLPLMNSSEILDLEQEFVEKNIIIDPLTAGGLYSSVPVSAGVEFLLQNKRGTLSDADLADKLSVLRGRNNYSQIEDYMLQAASSTNYNLSVSGGQDKYSFFTSASYAKEETQSKGVDGKRLTLTANQNFELFDFAKVSTSLKGSFFDFNKNGLGISPLQASPTTFLPYDQIVDGAGNSVDYYRAFYSADIQNFEQAGYLPWTYNYMDELANANNGIKEQNYSANISVTLPLFDGLSAMGTYFIERSNTKQDQIYGENTYYTRDQINQATYLNPTTQQLTRGIPLGAIYKKNNYTESSQTMRGQLNYNNTFGKHTIDAIAGMELRQVRTQVSGGDLFGYNERTQRSTDLPSTTYTSVYGYNKNISYNQTATDQRRRFLSYYANAAYTFDTKYVLSGSVRLDDYNNFGVDKSYRRTPLWSTGLKWNMNREDFLKDVEIINNLSFRATYGFNGNISLTTFPFTNISIGGTDYNLSRLPYAFIAAPANPALRWEKTGVLNFGLDFNLFDKRLGGSVEYYVKNSDDLIQDFPVSEFYGLPNNNTLTRNTATLRGEGVDINLNGEWLRTPDFSINSTFILSYNKNEVTDSRYENYSTFLNGTASAPPIVDYPLNSVFAFRSAGLDENGSTIVYDRNGEIVDAFTPLTEIEDMQYMGTSTPKYYGSFATTFTYKKLSLYALATYKLDYVLFKPSFGNYVSRYGSFEKYDLNSDIADRWRVPGDEASTNVPGAQGLGGYSLGRYLYSTDRIIDGDYIRLREISLSYDFSDLVANTFLRNASLSLSARNLGLIWRANDDDIDPDFLPYTNGNLIRIPPTAMYSVGVNLNF